VRSGKSRIHALRGRGFSAAWFSAGADGLTDHRDDTWGVAVAEHTAVFEELRPPLDRAEALLEADRCLECGGPHAPAPCAVACPAEIDVARFVAEIAAGDPEAAAQTIFAENLLGGTCSRVCPVEILCEGACVLVHENRPPIAIGALQRFATDLAFEQVPVRPRRQAPPNGRRVAVIGAGPAGLACAGELAALGYAVTVYDEREEPGGLVRYGIAPYRQSREPLPAEALMLLELGVELRLGTAIDSPEKLREIEVTADAVFLGIGLGADVDVELDGNDLPGVWDSLPFIEAIKTGRLPEVGPRVVVIGGGNTAVDVAREAVRLGADVVALLYRRTEAEMPAYPHEVAEAREEGVRIVRLTAPVRFAGNGRLEGVECIQMRLGARDASGRRRPEQVPGSEHLVPADTAVMAIGQAPRSELLSWIEGLEMDGGRIAIDPLTGRTGNAKYFAAGDAVSGGATVVDAVRGAKLAAREIDRRLGGGS
jgi:dihydropyrimidine dehydrogenase (NAD+) subunit PreT